MHIQSNPKSVPAAGRTKLRMPISNLPVPTPVPTPSILSDFSAAAIIPCIITLIGGVCGLAAVLSVCSGRLELACWLCLLTYYTDVADGSLARATGGCSKLGAKLDDLCDIVGHGVACFAILAALHFQQGGPSAMTIGCVALPFLAVCFCRGTYFSIRVRDFPSLPYKSLPPVMYAGLPTTYVAPSLASIWLLTKSPCLVLLGAAVGSLAMLPFCYYPLERMLEHAAWKRIVFVVCSLSVLFLPLSYGACATLALNGTYIVTPAIWADYRLPRASPRAIFNRAVRAARE